MAVDDRIRYLEEVQDLYLALRGNGLCLSPLDVDLVGGWWAAGVPLGLALDAVRDAAERHRGSGRAAARRPFPLRLAASLVEDRFGGYVRRSGTVARRDAPGSGAEAEAPPAPAGDAAARADRNPGGPPAPPADPLVDLAKLLRARAEGAALPAALAYRTAAEALERARASGDRFDRALARADEAQAVAYLQALPRPEQRGLARAAVRAAGSRGRVPRGAHRVTLRVHLGEAARRHGGLLRPSDLP